MPDDYQLVTLTNGQRTLFSASYGEKMHPGLGPQAEADLLYVRQLRIRERLAEANAYDAFGFVCGVRLLLLFRRAWLSFWLLGGIRMRTLFAMLGFVFMLSLAGCQSPSPHASLPPVPITPVQFNGHHFHLVSNKLVEEYWFVADGHVAVTAGRKHGPRMAPLFYWQIANGDTLVIRDSAGAGSVVWSYRFGIITNSMAVTVDGQKFEIE